MGKLWRIWKGSTKLTLNEEFAYRFNFLLKFIGGAIFRFFTPILVLLIYATSSGIPGWSFNEFLLLVGTFTLVMGIGETFLQSLTYKTIDKIWSGRFDIDLIRPVRPLLLVTAEAFDADGINSLFAGLVITIIALLKLNWIFNISNLIAYIFLILLAILVLYSVFIIIAAFSFVFTKTWVLSNMIHEIFAIGKSPLTIYGSVGTLLLTFVLPIGLAAFYPASALLGRLSWNMIGLLTLVALAFFGFAISFWAVAMKKYTSAGG